MNSDADLKPETVDELLARKFPKLRRVRSMPGLTLINGCGTRLSGRRDFDEETGSHVATRVFALLFVPVLALNAWRIVPAGGSRFHVLGREPLSPFARGANALLAGAVLFVTAMLGRQSYTESPEYRSRMALERAAEAMAAGKPLTAMREYITVFDNGWPAGDSREKYAAAFAAALRTGTVADRCAAVAEARMVSIRQNTILPNEAALILTWSAAEPDAGIAAAVMKAGLPSVPESDRAAYEARRRELLEKVTAASPGHADAAIDLAAIYDEENRPEDCLKLLEPHRAVLGNGEGARILGRIMVHEGRYREGADLLREYSTVRLREYHAAEKQMELAYKAVSDAAIADLNGNRAPDSFYKKYNSSSKEVQERMVDEFVSAKMKASPRLAAVQENMAAAGAVVPVMLDLGIATLHIAREEPDAAKRKQGLEEAERHFLAIEGAAGESTEYRLFLGQVYYWMGKHTEGRSLFDKLLAENRDTGVALMVAESQRQVGDMENARLTAEKAWKNASTKEDRSRAASIRAVLWLDIDDRILWLDRCEVRSPGIEISLLEAKADKKVEDGKKAEAVPLLREALAGYEKQPRNASTLNNSANLLSTLYGITHDPADARESLNRYEEASRLEPEDTVLLTNLKNGFLHRMYFDLAGEYGDLKTVPAGTEFMIVSMMNKNQDEGNRLAERMHQSDPARRAARILEKLLILAPRSAEHCRALQTLHDSCRRPDDMKKLLAVVKEADLDLTEAWSHARKSWTTSRDAESLAATEASLRETESALAALPAGATPELKASLRAQALILATSRSRLTKSGKPEELMAAAEALVKQLPASGSFGTAQSALLRAAVLQAAAADPGFAALEEASRRQLDDGRLIAFALKKGTGAAALKASAALQRWIDLIRREAAIWPDHRGIIEWALLRHLDAAAAGVCREAVLKDELRLTGSALDTLLAPWDPDTVVDAWALHQLRGDEQSAAAVWAAAKQQGMPLPDL